MWVEKIEVIIFEFMKKTFLSETTEQILHDYAVKNLEKSDSYIKYKNVVESICTYCNKDFLKLDARDAKRYFRFCENIKLNDESTLVFKRSVLVSIASFVEENYKTYDLIPYPYSDAYRMIYFEDSQLISPDSLPKLKNIDRLISYLLQNKKHRTLLAVLLAVKLALTASEILNIRYSDFIENDNGCKILRIRSKRPPDRFIQIPSDLVTSIELYASEYLNEMSAADPESFLFKARNNSPLAYRTLSGDLKNTCKAVGVDITFNDLRNLSIAYMIKNGATEDDISKITGTTGTLYRRFNPAVEAIIKTSVEYNCIYVRF